MSSTQVWAVVIILVVAVFLCALITLPGSSYYGGWGPSWWIGPGWGGGGWNRGPSWSPSSGGGSRGPSSPSSPGRSSGGGGSRGGGGGGGGK